MKILDQEGLSHLCKNIKSYVKANKGKQQRELKLCAGIIPLYAHEGNVYDNRYNRIRINIPKRSSSGYRFDLSNVYIVYSADGHDIIIPIEEAFDIIHVYNSDGHDEFIDRESWVQTGDTYIPHPYSNACWVVYILLKDSNGTHVTRYEKDGNVYFRFLNDETHVHTRPKLPTPEQITINESECKIFDDRNRKQIPLEVELWSHRNDSEHRSKLKNRWRFQRWARPGMKRNLSRLRKTQLVRVRHNSKHNVSDWAYFWLRNINKQNSYKAYPTQK